LSIYFQKHQIVAPGELLAEGNFDAGEGAFKENNKIYAAVVGLAQSRGRKIYVVPLQGSYFPKPGDLVIGKIIDYSPAEYFTVDINSAYSGILYAEEGGRRSRSLAKILSIGDIIACKIVSFDRTHDPILTIHGEGLGKLKGGRIIEISPMKIPRVIGRKGSMIKMIKEETNSKIKVGQNGRIWFLAPPKYENLLVRIIKKIERESHTSGLTDRIKEIIKAEKEEKQSEHGEN